MEEIWEEGGVRTRLSENTGGDEAMLWPVMFQCVGVWISAGLPYTYVYTSQLSICVLNYDLRNFDLLLTFRNTTTS